MSADEHGHVLVEDGRSLVVADDGERIGDGPWARWLASAVVPDESSARAQRGRTLARTGAVDSVSISAGASDAPCSVDIRCARCTDWTRPSTAGASGGRLRADRTVSCQTRAGTGAAWIDTS